MITRSTPLHPKLVTILDQIDEALCDREIGAQLGAVLSALRGPDNEDYPLKEQTACVVRAIAFPKLFQGYAESPSGAHRLWTMNGGRFMLPVPRPHLDSHYCSHQEWAAIVLGLLDKPLPYFLKAI